MEVHLVSKTDNQEHTVATLHSPGSENQNPSLLPPSCVRVRPVLISLTSNNLSYARGGDILHWWDTYPVPTELSPPYNDRQSWGIVPAWGFGVVTDSHPDHAIEPGTVLWGFWATADIPVLLHLRPSGLEGHWTDISESRQRLMTVYNVYSEEGRVSLPAADPKTTTTTTETTSLSSLFPENALRRMAWKSLFRPTWQTGYLFSRHTFTASPETQPPIHPWGMDVPWTAEDADISAAVVISLSAASKTGRSFAYHVFRRGAHEGPLGFLQVSQTPGLLEPVARKLGSSIPTTSVRYDQLGETVEWVSNLDPARIVVVDFGARAGTLDQLLSDIKGHRSLGKLKMTIIQVGSEQKVYSAAELARNRELMQTMGKIRFNTSGVCDAAIQLTNAQDFHSHVQSAWEEWVRISHEINPDIQVTLNRGVSGNDGIEGGWSRLCKGSVGAQEGLAYLI